MPTQDRHHRRGGRSASTTRRLVLLACLGLGAFILVSFGSRRDAGETGALEETLNHVTKPAVVGGQQVSESIGERVGPLRRLWRAQQRVLELEAENQHLRQENLRYHSMARELRDLQQQLNVKPDVPFDFVPASVVVRDIDSLLDAVVIDRGERDGVAVNMPVLADGLVVGRVERVLPGAARVLLLSDANSRVGVRVKRSGVLGILKGSISRRSPSLRLELAQARPGDVRVGDEIVTADESVLFPPGLPVGVVTELQPSSVLEETDAIVRPTVDLRSISTLQVITSLQRQDALTLAQEPAAGPGEVTP